MAKSYTSPIEEIAKRLEKEAGIHPFHMSLENEQARFGFPPEVHMTMAEQLQQATQPVGGRQQFKPHANDAQFKDTNKQLSLPASSTIQQAAYWRERQYLVVSFKSGHSYDYSGVELLKMLQWEQAASAGSFFYYNIRMNYPYKKLG